MNYGASELKYAKPVADELVVNPEFRRWVLSQTKFAARAVGARLLHEEMLRARSKTAKFWWRSHYSEKCTCPGCRGQEADLLAIFEDAAGERFALHVEVKHPGDSFKVDGHQAEAYPIRARCWAGDAPEKVLGHSDATTMLLCSASRLGDYEQHRGHFGSVLTFETVAGQFPGVYGHGEVAEIAERETIAGSLIEVFDTSQGLPPIPEWQVEFNKQMIAHHCTSEAQKAAAMKALDARDRSAFDAIVYTTI